VSAHILSRHALQSSNEHAGAHSGDCREQRSSDAASRAGERGRSCPGRKGGGNEARLWQRLRDLPDVVCRSGSLCSVGRPRRGSPRSQKKTVVNWQRCNGFECPIGEHTHTWRGLMAARAGVFIEDRSCSSRPPRSGQSLPRRSRSRQPGNAVARPGARKAAAPALVESYPPPSSAPGGAIAIRFERSSSLPRARRTHHEAECLAWLVGSSLTRFPVRPPPSGRKATQ
jgi:hypothetical protein